MTITQTKSVVQQIELPAGVTLQYVEQGDPSGTPVLLLHGVTDSWRSFEPVLPLLPESLHVFALTQRGHGDADRRAASYRFRHFSADIAAFMDAVGLQPAVIAGHSMGASVAQRFAIDHPARVRGLALMGTFARYRGNAVIEELWETGLQTLEDPIDPEFAREFQASTLAHSIDPDYFEMVVQESLKMPARIWRDAFQGFLEEEFPDELSKIAVPTLLVWGSEDAFVPFADQEMMTRVIPDARFVLYAGTGHALHWEQPERFVSDLTEFVTGLES